MLTLQTYEKPHMTDNDLNMLITKYSYSSFQFISLERVTI